MAKTVNALKDLYVALGGSESDVASCTKTVQVLNKISALYSGTTTATKISEAIENIADAQPSGGDT